MTGNRPSNQETEQVRPNTLGLSSRQLEDVLDLLEQQAGSTGDAVGRIDARWPFRHTSLHVNIQQPGGSTSAVQMACRNLSRTGAGLLHSAFAYPGTKCTIKLPHPQDGDMTVSGEIVRCQHRGGVLHEIGVRFDREIDLRCFVRPDPMREWFTVEHIDPAALVGTVLYVEPSNLDAQVVKHYLRETQVRLRVCDKVERAVEIAREGVDLVVSEFRIDEMTCEDLVTLLRAENVLTPIVLCSADRGGHVTELVDGRRAQAYLGKPISQDKLIQALAEFLTSETQGGADMPDLDRSLVKAMKPELIRCAKAIERAVERDQPMEVLSTCMQLQSAAPTIGLADLCTDLSTLVEQLSVSMSVDDVRETVTRVVKRCRAA